MITEKRICMDAKTWQIMKLRRLWTHRKLSMKMVGQLTFLPVLTLSQTANFRLFQTE